MTKRDAERQFKEMLHGYCDKCGRAHKPCGKRDRIADFYAWSCFVDMLCKDGQITLKQYETWEAPRFI